MFVLTKSKYRMLANICGDFTQVFFASLIIPVIIGGFDIGSLPVVIFGVVAMLVSFYFSIFFAEKGKL